MGTETATRVGETGTATTATQTGTAEGTAATGMEATGIVSEPWRPHRSRPAPPTAAPKLRPWYGPGRAPRTTERRPHSSPGNHEYRRGKRRPSPRLAMSLPPP